ncbi:BLUF domain-containing protein [Stenotrophomonas maltophilia]|uniref:BLUF domain-containing protein n=1 Tax=Stenotrophomonas maltophilia group TaxID=995085 RepID=UPI0015E001A9|nr:BLUF domain-containing protein [Stenotrophomonas maltophilia]MBA0390257.1 BLUF domain-containing protein [Stenotrophomonas maltophilia]MBA0464159.1 BLUF domain-containing protein [Stenotrophomonas maltophilia]MBA0471300.1 BLUF domain-containing protein [Stenotrophomonas maltophilia]
MPLRAIAYASEAIPGLSMDHVDDLAWAAAGFNFESGVTGVLLYDGLRFLQYIEGREDSINVVYSRILSARSHRELIELGRGRVSGRFFPDWSMRLLWVEASEIRSVARGNWDGLSRGGALRQLSLVVAPHLG